MFMHPFFWFTFLLLNSHQLIVYTSFKSVLCWVLFGVWENLLGMVYIHLIFRPFGFAITVRGGVYHKSRDSSQNLPFHGFNFNLRIPVYYYMPKL